MLSWIGFGTEPSITEDLHVVDRMSVKPRFVPMDSGPPPLPMILLPDAVSKLYVGIIVT